MPSHSVFTTVSRSAQAETDLEIILEDLQQKNPAVAERYANAFYDKGKALAQFPEIGRGRPEIAPQLPSTLVHPYVISCRVLGEEVQTLRILHGRSDLRSIMRAEPGG